MKKKLLLWILVIVLAIGAVLCVVFLGGNNSNEEPNHEHEYTTLKHDEINHWYECTCGEKQGEEAHKGGTATTTSKAVCSVCNIEYGEKLVDTHVHIKALTKSGTGSHWYVCSCGEEWGMEAHNGGTATCTQKATCSVCLSEYGEYANHKYSELKKDNDKHWYECVCGEKSGAENHKGGTATCNEKAKCSVCNTGYGEFADHKYDTLNFDSQNHWKECVCRQKDEIKAHVPGAEATENTDQICLECNFVITPSLGHVHSNHLTINEAKPNSCTKEGNIEYYVCSCGRWFVDSSASEEITDKASVIIDKKQHEYNTLKFDENTHWKECSCGAKDVVEAHKGGNATCIKKAECEVCHTEYGSFEPHVYDSLKFDGTNHWNECKCGNKQGLEVHKGGTATCIKKAKCEVCHADYGEFGDHDYSKQVIAPKCEEGGYTIYTCQCGDTYNGDFTNPTDHAYGEWESSGNGFHTKTCTNDTTHIITEDCDGGEATCLNKAKCSVCNRTYGEVAECNYKDGVCIWCGDTLISEGLAYKPINNDTEYEVVGKGTCKDYDIVIPATYNNLPVTSIGDEAFLDDALITSVEIPDSVTCIGEWCFRSCKSLRIVNIGQNSKLTTLSDQAFYNCEKLEGIRVPATVTTIGRCAFACTLSLGSILVDSGNANYKSIDGDLYSKDGKTLIQYALGKRVLSFDIPNGVETIGNDAFDSSPWLKTIKIPSTVNTIGTSAFYNSSIESLQIPEDVKVLDEYTLGACEDLKSLVLPSSLTTVGVYCTYSCSSLEKVYYLGTEENADTITYEYGNDDLKNTTWYYYLETQPEVGDKYWHYVNGIPTVWSAPTYSQGLTYKLVNNTEYQVSGLGTCTDLDIFVPPTYEGKPVTAINSDAFSNKSTITSIVLPKSIVNIYDNAFYQCTSLSSVSIPEGVQMISHSAFSGCTALKTISLPTTLTFLGQSAFFSSGLTSIELPSGIGGIRGNVFQRCASLKTVVIPSGLTYIDGYAFHKCTSLKSLQLPDTLKSIYQNAFYESALESIVIPASVENLYEYAFYDANMLSSITFEENSKLKKIGNLAFYNCKFTSIELPASVYEISSSAFTSVPNLANISVNSNNLTYKSIDGVLYSKDGTKIIFYPNAKTEKTFTIPAGVTSIESSAFYKCANLESVIIPESVTSIGTYSFRGCTNLKSVAISNNVKIISAGAFADCSSLQQVYIGKVNTINARAFEGCTALTDVYYAGAEADKSGILIRDNNSALYSATWHYSSSKPN